jgi:hypothetical protein
MESVYNGLVLIINAIHYSYKCVGQFRIAKPGENDGQIISPASYVSHFWTCGVIGNKHNTVEWMETIQDWETKIHYRRAMMVNGSSVVFMSVNSRWVASHIISISVANFVAIIVS